jgi:hypothetical protein
MSKALVIHSAIIKVSANQFSKTGYIATSKIMGVLPNCRKVVTLSDSLSFHVVHVRPLFTANGTARICPSDWKKLMETMPIVIDKNAKFDVTPDIAAHIRKHFVDLVTCPAVNDGSKNHPDYKVPEYNELVVLNELPV